MLAEGEVKQVGSVRERWLMAVHEKQLVVPPRALTSGNPLRWLRFFGPGAIIASLNLGSGETLFSSRGGAIFGYRILWVFLIVALLKWVLTYSSMRHMILSGAHPFERWSRIRGPRGWFPLFMFIIAVLSYPLWFSFLAGLLGTICAWMFEFSDHYVWATVFMAAAFVLLTIGGYQFFEKAQMIILGLTAGCMVVATFYVRPDWFSVLKGAVLPQAMAYPDWLPEKLPQFRLRSVWVEVLVYVSAIGGTTYDYLGYTSFMRDKRWGWSHLGLASSRDLEQTAEQPHHPARIWLRAALTDTAASFFMIVLLSSCFVILGTVILQPIQQVPEGTDLLNHQASFLTTLSPWLLPLYKLAIFLTFFGSIYGVPELAFRVVYEYLNTLPRWEGRLPVQKIRWAVIVWCMGGGLVVLWASRAFPEVQLVDIVTPAAIYTGVLTCGFYCLANPWMDRRFLPPGLRMPTPLALLNIVSGIIFVALGLKALWDYGQVGAFLTFSAILLACIFLASQLRFLHRRPTREGSFKLSGRRR